MPTTSRRGREMPASPIRKLVPLSNAAKARGIKVYHLNIGQPDLPSPPQAFEALKNIDFKLFEYSPSDGLPSLRRKLAEYYHRFNIDVTADDIIITSGGSEAVLFAFMACLDPGTIIVPGTFLRHHMASPFRPAWIVTVPSSIETGLRLPSSKNSEKLITPRTKGTVAFRNRVDQYDLILDTGQMERRYIRSAGIAELAVDLVGEEEEIVAFDNITQSVHLPGIEDQVVLIDSVSKRYSECGIRIGALITKNPEVRKAVMKFCQARLSPPLLGQIVAEASIDATPEYMLMTYNDYVDRRKFLIDGLNRIPGVYSPIPMGAFYTVVSLPVDDADRFCRWCLEEFSFEGATVFMAPASGFYSTPGRGKNEVRMAYVLNRDDLGHALRVLAEALKAYPGRTI